MGARERIYCRQLGVRLHLTFGLPRTAGDALASLLLRGGAGSLRDVAAANGISLGEACVGCSGLVRVGAAGHRVRWHDGRRVPLTEQLRRLRTAYQEGGIGALHEAHVSGLECVTGYGRLSAAVERICPVSKILRFGAQLEASLRRDGLSRASSALLSQLPEPWEIRLPARGRDVLRRSPLIVFGNHPSMLTPFLLAAALERDDLRVLAHRYVTTLVPGLTPYVLPLERAHRFSARSRWITGPAHGLSLAALDRFEEGADTDAARRTNRESLRRGIEQVCAGGAVAIFPNGGRERGPWYPGLGRLVAALRDTEACLVPMHEANSSNRRVYRLLREKRRGSGAVEPIRLVVGEPIDIRRLVLPADVGAEEIVALLRAVYDRAEW